MAICWIFGFLFIADSKSVTRFDSVECLKSLEAIKCTSASILVVPLIMKSPTLLYIGSLSPVKFDSSNEPLPLIISPSKRTFSPDATTTISPTFTLSSLQATIAPLIRSFTSLGICLPITSKVSAAFFLLNTSKNLPISTKVIIILTESK